MVSHCLAVSIVVFIVFLLMANPDQLYRFFSVRPGFVLFRQIKMIFSFLIWYPFNYLKTAFIVFPLNVLFLHSPIEHLFFFVLQPILSKPF